MTDAKLTQLTGALLVAVRDQVDHLIGGGFNLPDKLPWPDPVQCGIVTRMFQQRYGEKSKWGA